MTWSPRNKSAEDRDSDDEDTEVPSSVNEQRKSPYGEHILTISQVNFCQVYTLNNSNFIYNLVL